MCEDCWSGPIIGLIIVWLLFLFVVIDLASDMELGEWISDWLKSWIRRLPHPKY